MEAVATGMGSYKTMSDEYKGKNGKVRVVYVRSDDDKNKRAKGQRTNKKVYSETPAQTNANASHYSHYESRKPGVRNENKHDDSPWGRVSRSVSGEESKSEHGGISGNSAIGAEQLRRQRMEETRVYGENACQELFYRRPEAIVRGWFMQEVTPRFREALRWMAANHKAYHVVDDKELAKASGSEHHGGVCFLIKKRPGIPVEQWLSKAEEKDCVLALKGIGNPHNIGGIMRSCAHFGVRGLMAENAALLESGAAVRTAEGGAEHIQAITAEDFANGLELFRRAGYTIVSTTSHKGEPLTDISFPARIVLVSGQMHDGLSDISRQQGDTRVSVIGTGRVESLNVSVAIGVILAEWWRQNN